MTKQKKQLVAVALALLLGACAHRDCVSACVEDKCFSSSDDTSERAETEKKAFCEMFCDLKLSSNPQTRKTAEEDEDRMRRQCAYIDYLDSIQKKRQEALSK